MIATARIPQKIVSVTLLVASLVVGCSLGPNLRLDNATLAEPACSARVIVRFSSQPDSALLADLGRANELELELLDSITAELGVYILRARDRVDDCAAAIDRLRRDARVRSIDLDTRRELHDE